MAGIYTSLIPGVGDDEVRPVPERVKVLHRAEALTCGPREKDYGSPAKSFAKAAAMWSPVLGVEVTGQQVALCMALVKISRLIATPGHQDSHDDAAAYIAIAYECAVAAEQVDDTTSSV